MAEHCIASVPILLPAKQSVFRNKAINKQSVCRGKENKVKSGVSGAIPTWKVSEPLRFRSNSQIGEAAFGVGVR